MLARDAVSDGVHVGLRLADRYARPESSDRLIHPMRPGRQRARRQHERRPHFDGGIRGWELKARRHDPRHDVGLIVEAERSADHVRIGSEAARPGAGAQQNLPLASRLAARLVEEAAQGGGHAQCVESARRDLDARDALGLDAVGDRESAVAPDAERGKALRALPPIEERQARDIDAFLSFSAVALPECDQARRFRERQWTEQHGVDDRENRRVDADSDGQRDDDHDSEAGTRRKRPDRLTQLPNDRRHRPPDWSTDRCPGRTARARARSNRSRRRRRPSSSR